MIVAKYVNETDMPAPIIPYFGIRMKIEGIVTNNPTNEP